MRLLLNLIWLVFGGLVMAAGYALTALVMLILIITIPFGIASARIALFCLWPFGPDRAAAGRGNRLSSSATSSGSCSPAGGSPSATS